MADGQAYALIKQNRVVNLVAWDGVTPYEPDCDEIVLWSSLPEGVQIGWLRDDEGNWAAPE
ncbi:MAG: hypothetical protein A3E78_11700 [Alphaproteobacteria bacterium RIFCSPHIGHO2_12_FULL_63_12]|nr:MAG: hypothetical protein A3E78_11700 [Alphaproteobacteria bacterium RIFCSPHIGHO2_12_FULL_63_12]